MGVERERDTEQCPRVMVSGAAQAKNVTSLVVFPRRNDARNQLCEAQNKSKKVCEDRQTNGE